MTKLSYKKRTSSDARILIALMRNQPLTKEELIKDSGISESQFYRVKGKLTDEKILRRVGEKYVINVGGYKNGFVELDDFLHKASQRFVIRTVSLKYLASQVGKPPRAIEDAAYALAKKYNIKIGRKTVPRLEGKPLLEMYK